MHFEKGGVALVRVGHGVTLLAPGVEPAHLQGRHAGSAAAGAEKDRSLNKIIIVT